MSNSSHLGQTVSIDYQVENLSSTIQQELLTLLVVVIDKISSDNVQANHRYVG